MSEEFESIHRWPELARQANWSAAELAEFRSPYGENLRQYFIKHMRRSLGTWLPKPRQHQVIELLRDGSTIKETAASLGYKQQTNLTSKFKNQTGISPSVQKNTSQGRDCLQMIGIFRK